MLRRGSAGPAQVPPVLQGCTRRPRTKEVGALVQRGGALGRRLRRSLRGAGRSWRTRAAWGGGSGQLRMQHSSPSVSLSHMYAPRSPDGAAVAVGEHRQRGAADESSVGRGGLAAGALGLEPALAVEGGHGADPRPHHLLSDQRGERGRAGVLGLELGAAAEVRSQRGRLYSNSRSRRWRRSARSTRPRRRPARPAGGGPGRSLQVRGQSVR